MDTGPLLDILHEDADLLVVNKPAGLVCHPTKDGERSSLIGRVRLHLGHNDGRLVNRLDRETSGIVLLARQADIAGQLGRLFGTGQVRKTYWAIVHGALACDLPPITGPIGRDEGSPVAIKGCVRTDGAAASTSVTCLRVFVRGGGVYSLVQVTPHTGRKHQIRIHLASIGHPIVGDKLYGSDEQRYLRLVHDTLTHDDWRALLLRNQALHAGRVSLTWRERDWTWSVPPPPAFRAFASASPPYHASRPTPHAGAV